MIIVIDGYNVLKQVFLTDHISETQRSAFVNLLGRYGERRGHKIQIVFDAGPCRYPMQEKQRGVVVIFSGEFQSADDFIMKFCEENKQKDILVVTADREIIRSIQASGAQNVDPHIFYEKVHSLFEKSKEAQKKQRGHVVKTSQDSDAYVDALMLEGAGMSGREKEDRCDLSDTFDKGNETSKKERKRKSVLNKL